MCVLNRRILALKVAADEYGPTTVCAGDIHRCLVEKSDFFSQHLDVAAGLAVVCARGVQGAAVGHDTVGATVEDDLAVFFANGACLNQTCIVHHCPGQLVCYLGGHHHLAAICGNRPKILHPGAVCQARFVHGQSDQFIAFQIKGETVARGQDCRAEPGLNHPGVFGVISSQHDVAAFTCRQGALVGDAVAGIGIS